MWEQFTVQGNTQYLDTLPKLVKQYNNTEPELLRAKQDVFRIDKVLWRDYKKKQALVKWKGYDDKFNSWIPLKNLKDS